VRELLVAVNAQVDAGAALLRLDRAGEDAEAATGERVALPDHDAAEERGSRGHALSLLAEMQALLTGHDLSAPRAHELVQEYAEVRGRLPVDDPALLHAELDVLTTFADLAELSRNRPTSAEEEADSQVHSPREFFHSYLHSLDIEREALPEDFRSRLCRALLHYDVRSLDPGPRLEEAVHRIFLAQQRTANQLPAVLALLDRWLTAGQLPDGPARGDVEKVLERLIVAAQLRFPSVGDLARAVRFRSFEQPVVLQARQAVFDEAERLLGELVQGDNGDNAQRIEALVASPEPLIRLLAQRFGSASTAPEPILEVLTRRYYRRRSLENLRSFRLDGRPCVTGEYALSGAQLHLVSLMAEVGELAEALTSLGALMEGSPTRRTSSSTCTCRGPTGPRTPTRCRRRCATCWRMPTGCGAGAG
jgi:hypothetical protein